VSLIHLAHGSWKRGNKHSSSEQGGKIRDLTESLLVFKKNTSPWL